MAKTRMTKRMKSLGLQLRDQSNMNYKDLKRNCVARGIPFIEVPRGVPHLSKWLYENRDNPINTDLLDDYDKWLEPQLPDDSSNHPSLRLGYVGETDDDGNVTKVKRIKGLKKTKVKRERTDEGIFAGTKKALTFQLAKEGLDKADVIEQVLEAFPDAKSKSIGIWYKKALREMK